MQQPVKHFKLEWEHTGSYSAPSSRYNLFYNTRNVMQKNEKDMQKSRFEESIFTLRTQVWILS